MLVLTPLSIKPSHHGRGRQDGQQLISSQVRISDDPSIVPPATLTLNVQNYKIIVRAGIGGLVAGLTMRKKGHKVTFLKLHRVRRGISIHPKAGSMIRSAVEAKFRLTRR